MDDIKRKAASLGRRRGPERAADYLVYAAGWTREQAREWVGKVSGSNNQHKAG